MYTVTNKSVQKHNLIYFDPISKLLLFVAIFQKWSDMCNTIASELPDVQGEITKITVLSVILPK